ncbi:rhodanese-like domain-containing protein [Pelagicoccus albus]|uniref:Rhodanese-like domain-containing protein n=1 Tax=Pelagicoccus albus TaxID=415222 RepID=A0A7X1EAG9_9BACT|nr:rhodanese-like domain-containing protein [Pelagicoccus albus]MBC2606757.1 rhodanese-like domain-containing protein [Pelagicoccus albus]
MNNYVFFGLLILAAVIFYVLKQRGQMNSEEAKAALEKGAVIIDVRTQQEYMSGSVPGALNFPLNEVVARVSKRFPDKKTVLLCHCASGMRSASAVSQLKQAGYANAHNIGSYQKALSLRN